MKNDVTVASEPRVGLNVIALEDKEFSPDASLLSERPSSHDILRSLLTLNKLHFTLTGIKLKNHGGCCGSRWCATRNRCIHSSSLEDETADSRFYRRGI